MLSMRPTGTTDNGTPGTAWAARADALAGGAGERHVNRTDVWGGYAKDGQLTLPAKGRRGRDTLTRDTLARHFRATERAHVVGLHSTSPDNTSRWACIDI